MEDDYKMDMQETSIAEGSSGMDVGDNMIDPKDFGDIGGFDEGFEEDDGSGYRNNRGRGNYRNARGRPPQQWMNGPPRFRGRGYGPQGPPMRGRGFFRGRGTPRFNNAPNFDPNWGPMGPPPPGMMGGPPPFGPPPGMMPGGPMGPPPNMMGQPPPFGGPPPISGVPNMPNPELWVETKSEDGKSYFYHARTRETTWTRPQEGPGINCKVVTQAEIEAMAANGMMQGGPQQQMPMGMALPNGAPMMQPGQAPPFMNQPPPWLKDQNQQSGGDKTPSETDEMPPGETGPMQPPLNQPPPNSNQMNYGMPPGGPNFSQAPPNFSGPPPGGPPAGYPGGWGGWGGWPPMVAQPPPNLANAAVPDSGAAVQQPPPMGMQPPGMQNQMPGVPGAMPGGPGAPANMAGGPPGASIPGVPGIAHMPGIPGGPGAMPGVPGMPGSMAGLPGAPGGNILPDIIPLDGSSPPQKKEEMKIPPEMVAAAAAWTTHRSPDGRPYYYHAANQESVWEKPQPLKDLEAFQSKLAAEKLREKRKYDPDNKDEVIDVDAHAEAQAAAEEVTKAAIEAEKKSVAEKERAEKERIEKEKMEKERAEKERLEKEKAEKEKAKADKSRPVSSTPITGTPWCVVWTGDGRVFFYNPTAHTSVWERPAQLAGRADVDKAVSQPPHALQKKESVVIQTKSANGEGKRHETDSDDSDDQPGRKKAKQDDKKPGQIDLGKEAAIEAEVRAARERGVVPHEQRLRSFLQMLHEKQVSAFSTWEKELHKIVFDPRYLMLNSKERRQVFDQYVRDRAEEERKEKKNRLQQKKTLFRALLEEAKLHSKSSFTEFSSKHGRDERFKSIEKSRDRELYFNEYITDLRKKEKDDKEKKREQVKADYIALLKEKGVDRHSRFQDVKKKIDSDARYKAVEGGAAREDIFREYCKQMKDDRRKDKDTKDRDRSVKKDKKDKERDKEGKEGKEKKKKEKAETEEDPKRQPTPPPEQWADIIGVPGEDKARGKKTQKDLKDQKDEDSDRTSISSQEDQPSPKQLRSSKKEQPTPTKAENTIKTPPKKRKIPEEFKSPEKEIKEKRDKKKLPEKTEKRKRKKTEKD